MQKYLQITTDVGVELIAADDVLYCQSSTSSAAKIALKGGSNHIAVSGANLTSGFAEAVHAALIVAAETKWTEVVSVVKLPGGVTIQSLTVTSGV